MRIAGIFIISALIVTLLYTQIYLGNYGTTTGKAVDEIENSKTIHWLNNKNPITNEIQTTFYLSENDEIKFKLSNGNIETLKITDFSEERAIITLISKNQQILIAEGASTTLELEQIIKIELKKITDNQIELRISTIL